MKKVIILVSALLTGMVWGQESVDPGTKNDIQKVFPATPETYSLFKAGDFPVDYRTGKMNVSVPLYEIKTKYGVTIPISLTYNTGGIKVDESSGIAGLGWSLSIPNGISVEMHGKNDLVNSVWFPKEPFNYLAQNFSQLPADIQSKLLNVKEGVLDTQPDIYHYNLPTISGSFIKDSNGNFQTIPYENVKISYANDKFTITDPKGVIYILRRGNTNNTISTVSSEAYFSSFVVEKIQFPNNEEVNFTYGKTMAYHHITHSFTDVYIPIEANDPICANSRKDVHTTTNNMYMDALLTEITHNGEKVTFNYANTIGGTQGRKDLNGGASNTYALSEVIATYNDKVVKKMALEHDYFTSFGGDESYKNFRLKLNKVKNILEGTEHSFEYDESNKPFLGSFSQDIWGYYNARQNLSMIPNAYYFNNNYTSGGNRNVNPQVSQAYILKKINYPTKGYSSFTYENNSIWQTLIIPQEEITPKADVIGVLNTGAGYATQTSPEFYLNDVPAQTDETITYLVDWVNSCANNTPPGTPVSIGDTNGYGYLEEQQPNGSWKILVQFQKDVSGTVLTAPDSHQPAYKKRLRVMLQSNNPDGGCSVSFSVSKKRVYKTSTDQNTIVGGLRIKNINDFDGQTNYTKRTFEYNKPGNLSNQSSGNIASPLEFLKKHYSVIKPSGYANQILCENFALSADQAESSSLSSRDAVAYEYVTESTLGRGKKVYQFPVYTNNLDITYPDAGFNPYQYQNKNILNEKSYSVEGNLLQEKMYDYELTYLKNPLSVDHLPASINTVALSTSIAFFDVNTDLISKINNSFVVESGKWLLSRATMKDYLNNTLTRETSNTYSLTDSNKPINLIKSQNLTSDGIATELGYQYATEQNNTDMIAANMVSVPLQTEAKENGKTISKTQTVYAKNALTVNMILPVSVQKFDKDNSTSSKNTIDYNQYDAKGNVLQYTAKGNVINVPTAIIWGYNNTMPIAKIEGTTYSEAFSFASDIIAKSNADTDAATEKELITALDVFRNQTALKNYSITTYTYDPLVGVTTVTPSTGLREFYKYDSAGRLQSVVDANGNILKEMNYNYKH
jgi:YD repeat-containing protein